MLAVFPVNGIVNSFVCVFNYVLTTLVIALILLSYTTIMVHSQEC